MSADRGTNRPRRRGFTLIEVAVSILLATVVILGAMMARYHSVRQARRADAYNGAGRLALLMLEGWRSYAAPDQYTPLTNFAGYFSTFTTGTGPAAPTGFTTLGGYRVILDNTNYYVTLAYVAKTTTAPAKLHAAVAFRHQYDAGSVASGANVVRLTTYD